METKSDGLRSAAADVFDVFDASHREIILQLEKLNELSVRLLRQVPCEQDAALARDLVAFFSGPAREHNYEEERHAFPALLQCGDPEVVHAAQSLQEEHAWIELDWLDLEPMLKMIGSKTSAVDQNLLQTTAAAFDSVMRDHIAIEESLMYPQLRIHLSDALRRSASRDIAARRAKTAYQAVKRSTTPHTGGLR